MMSSLTEPTSPPGVRDRPVLLLDVMDTLVRDPFRVEMPAFFGLSLRELIAAKHPTTWVEFELGAIDEAEALARFFADRRAVDADGFRAMLRGAYRWLPGIEPLLAELHAAGVAMHALSNYPVWYRLVDEAVGLGRYLAWSFVSCRTGLRKPDPQAYLAAAAALGRPPADCVFVDDRVENCAAADATGMRAIVFGGAHELRDALGRLGIP